MAKSYSRRAFRAFQKVKTLKPSRSLFDLSHDMLFTGDMGLLYPVCAMEMSPGDTFHIWSEQVLRMQPLNAPILHEINSSTHYFFAPYRILDDNFVDIITGGVDGEYGDNETPTDSAPALPRWKPTNNAIGSLWDYFGLPTGVDPVGAYPVDYIKRAYNKIWNDYYRDENLQEEVDITQNEAVLRRNWKKDYFTSALLGQQRGTAPSMPLSGSAPVTSVGDFDDYKYFPNIQLAYSLSDSSNQNASVFLIFKDQTYIKSTIVDAGYAVIGVVPTSDSNVPDAGNYITFRNMVFHLNSGNYGVSANYQYFGSGGGSVVGTLTVTLVCAKVNSSGSADLAGTNSVDVKDLRIAFQIQRWLELANRGGVRYTEFLRSFFGVSPRDDRLQRPEYIGGTKSPVVISEVLQTSATNPAQSTETVLATMAGHGVSATRTFVGSYTAVEFGVLIGVMSVMPTPKYAQGINRQWLRRTKYDFLFPQFTHLSEQAIEGAEIYATNNEAENRKVFGFNEIYDELRAMPSKIAGKMRSTFNYWHLARIFDKKPALNSEFIQCNPSKRIFAVPSEDGLIMSVANIIRAVRPLPKYGTPGGV
ncbi:MAG: hypothetical protein NC041_04200 [Bacteroides sp.]|nr:hypothetical protein [Prevotella sp.]MCM1407907.1 hypothetical protein [Treponema brennaborense]MCM1469649.1 hypothetical protein [Bacteroides sp.]